MYSFACTLPHTLHCVPLTRLRLKLKTIISLIPEEPTHDLTDYCCREDIRLIYIQAERFKVCMHLFLVCPPRHARQETPVLHMLEVTQVLQALIDPETHPVYMHCLDGGHNSGSIVVALRRLIGWDNAPIVAEHERWAADKEITPEEHSWIKEFQNPCQLVLPERMPKWLWRGSYLEKDGTTRKKSPKGFSRLKYPDPVGGEDLKLALREREAATAVVGSLDTLYDTRRWLARSPPHIPSTDPAACLPCTSFWTECPPSDGARDAPDSFPPRVTLSRQLQALWLHTGEEGASCTAPPACRPLHVAASFSDLRSAIS